MTMLAIPSFERQLLRAISEGVAAEAVPEWPEQSVQLCLTLLGKLRDNTAGRREQLEAILAGGVEARSFARNNAPLLATLDEQIAQVHGLVERLAPAEGAASGSLAGELRLLEQESQAFRDLLAEALSRASETPGPVDWGRVRAAEEAHARGETKPFSPR